MIKFLIISVVFIAQGLILNFLPITHSIIQKASASFLLSYILWFYIIGFFLLRDKIDEIN